MFKMNKRLNSEKGFTVTDLSIAIIIFLIFAGFIVTYFYDVYKINYKTKISSFATNYMIQIVEDIDKVTYNEVNNGMEEYYREKFSIPKGYNINIEVSDYNNGNNSEDLIKNVKVIIEYNLLNKTEKIIVNKIKVKEL